MMDHTGSSLSHLIASEKCCITFYGFETTVIVLRLHQEQVENLPRCDSHFLSDRVSQCGANGQGKKRCSCCAEIDVL